ncbi:YIP1 family protein [Halobium salinum]|uniref:YIP1 family protein n=1 Tax=Halobium salinum TaxID=1364940 RepID=A0ABD5PEE7_9EURY|nr:YIP1 family protein [Halobium salinum]
MTTWIENPEGGRDRGPAGFARAWLEALVRPRRFFRNGIAPGDQAPGLAFGVFVALCYVVGLLAFSPEPVVGTETIPLVAGSEAATATLLLLAVALFVAPATLHLTAALQTLLLIAIVPDRGGVSQTVQTIAYATAPCVFAGLPVPLLRVTCAAYGALLLVVGVAVVHRASPVRAVLAAAVPAALVFGYGFGGFAAAEAVLAGDGLGVVAGVV